MPFQHHTRRKRLSVEKLSQLQDRFRNENGAAAHSSAAANLNESEQGKLASQLFSKAPLDFLESRSIDELAAITQSCLHYLKKLPTEDSKLITAVEHYEDYTAIISLVLDRPFIVNTLSECVHSFGLKFLTMLHPILATDEGRISLVYMEVEPLTEDQSSLLVNHIGHALNDLILANDDFTAMLVRTETLAKTLEQASYRSPVPHLEYSEVADFLHWLSDGGFVFLGYADWPVNQNGGLGSLPSIKLGIFKTKQSYIEQLQGECLEDGISVLDLKNTFSFSKLRIESPVHRRSHLLCVSIPQYSEKGAPEMLHTIVGLLTSKALAQESSSVPIIRRKLQKILVDEDMIPNSHDYKYIVDIIDRMPKDQALRLDIEALRDITHSIIGMRNKSDTRVSLHLDSSKRGVLVLVIMPRDRFNGYVRGQIQQYLESMFGVPSDSSEYHLDLGNKPLARVYFYLPLNESQLPALEISRLEVKISEITKTWEENLQERVLLSDDYEDPNETWFKYSKAFPEDYQALQTVEECIVDLKAIDSLSGNDPIHISFFSSDDALKKSDSLVVYQLGSEISISKAFPVLENAGLEVLSEKISCVTPFGMQPVYVHRFMVNPKRGEAIGPHVNLTALGAGLCQILHGEASNDPLNQLMLFGNLSIDSISVLRAYCDFIWQISAFATRVSIIEAFAGEPAAAIKFWELFDLRFNPQHNFSTEERNFKFEQGLGNFVDILQNVSDLTRDRVLRLAVNVLSHTVRTNFFERSGRLLALKIESVLVESMPQPRPKFEIFVHGSTVNGVHLRSSKISRGGIRWSERNDDYRSEVLGLVKTQKIKNAVIVPDGAKGGFVVPNLPKEAELIPAAVESAYCEYIRALLSITDNMVDGNAIKPRGLVVYDEEDPYLVVAADKGTAAFSDVANAIAGREFDFWLGDAFASGGSYGYDHKKFGITAKGAWECVRRHFYERGMDCVKSEFTCVGIGDMSGDVFGNGALLSDKLRLIAAFNHKHVFIDPNPNTAESFAERRRLFKLAKSQWSDYDAKLISKGGGVFNRFDKQISLSPEALTALGIESPPGKLFSGEELISHILKAPVDLLWNGGIGTYVKSNSETHAEVNDGTNDRVRINADELRCKIVGEGGNLGFTQLARIDFSRLGGRINTDAIDNSAGVDLSDHEVNLKILFAGAVKSGKLTKDARDLLLSRIAPAVEQAVLRHNRNHSILLTVGLRRSSRSIEYFKSLVQLLHRMGFINRHMECLPDEDEFQDRVMKRQGMWSPELAVCVAGVKMWIRDALSQSPLCTDKRLEEFLVDYFPVDLAEDYRTEILNHPLARSIIASQVANTLIDAVGITFVHRMCVTYSARPIVVVKCLLAAYFILNAKRLQEALDQFDNFSDRELFLNLRQGLGKTLRDATSWIISCHGDTLSLDEIVKLYENSFGTMLNVADGVFTGPARDQYFNRLTEFRGAKLDDFSARTFALAPDIVPVLEILWASRRAQKDVALVARIFSQVLNDLGIATVLKRSEKIQTATKWEHQSLISSFEEIRRSTSLITCQLLDFGLNTPDEITKSLRSAASFDELSGIVEELLAGPIGASGLAVVARQLSRYKF